MSRYSATTVAFRFLLLALAASLACCGGGGGGDQPAPGNPAVSGTLTGMPTGSSIVLTDNGGDPLTVTANGRFTFPARLPPNSTYYVQIKMPPPMAYCIVTNGNGTIRYTDVTNVAVTCSSTPLYTVSGTLSGLRTGDIVSVQNNAADALTLAANGPFTFSAALQNNATYNVTVLAQPASGPCTVLNGAGAIAGANIASVVLSCNTVSTLAGSGVAGALDGSGAAATFSAPLGVTVDSIWNVYVADTANNKIREVTPLGVVTTFAGSGVAGAADGTGTTATFNAPGAVTVDTASNVYIADTNNNEIRWAAIPVGAETLAASVTTLAGTTVAGSADGPGATAAFDHPAGIAVDSAGNLYVADTNNNRIRKIVVIPGLVSPTGVVSTFAGSNNAGSADGTGTAATFNHPMGVAVDAAGNIYVADTGNNKVRKITSAGVVTTLAGSGVAGSADGTGAAASFNSPTSVSVDFAGNIYVADKGNNKIRQITPSGIVQTWAGTGAAGALDGTGAAAMFNVPAGLAVDSGGNTYVADSANNTIRKISP